MSGTNDRVCEYKNGTLILVDKIHYPHARIPPIVHAAKYWLLYSSIGFLGANDLFSCTEAMKYWLTADILL